MKKLSECTWMPFNIQTIFPDVQRGKRLKNGNHIAGNMPYVSSSASNNGVDNFISNTQRVRIFSECLTLTNSGSVGYAFYHPYSFVASDHVTKLKNPAFNKYIYLFIATVACRLAEKYNFNREINDSRLSREIIMLPVTEDASPDYEYMEEYMRAKEIELLEKYSKYLNNSNLNRGGQTLTNKEWLPFRIEDVCEITSGHDIYDRERISGDIPYITATATNNGIGHFVGNKNETLASNCISVNRNGSVGYAFYHDYEALYGNDTRKLVPFHKNKYSSLFIVRAILQQKDKYGYGYKMGTGRLKRQDIMLPAKSDGTPDYEYMEEVMKAMEHRLIKSYVDKRLQGVTV